MKKKLYNQPIVEATMLMPDTFVMVKVSEGTGDEGVAHAPARPGDIID